MDNKKKLCMAISNTFNMDEIEQLEKFSEHGIDGFFALYKDYVQVEKLKEFADKKGLFFQSIHAKHHPMRELWIADQKSERLTEILKDLKETVVSASKLNVDRVIMHVYTGFYDEEPTKEGLGRIGEILEVAEKHGVTLCFENLEGENFLDATLSEYNNCKYAKMCYDCGHENCYGTHKVVDKYKDKICALHINDNKGIRNEYKILSGNDDMHLLPFDGNVDFNRVVNIIKHANMQNELTFEFKFCKDAIADKYRQMSFDQYLKTAKEKMEKLANML